MDAGQLRLVGLTKIKIKIKGKKRKQKSGNNAQEISFERQHHRISYTDSKVRTTN